MIWINTPVFAEPPVQEQRQISYTQQLLNYLTYGASMTVGIGSRETHVQVERLDTHDNGKLVDRDEDSWFLSYNTRASYFKNSRYGYAWLFNISTFEVSQQQISKDVVLDLGTHVEGYFAYAVPTFFYNWGDLHRGTWVRVGFGIGLGISEFNGDIILTETSIPNDRVEISNGASKIFIAPGLFIEAQVDWFTFRLAAGGPDLKYEGYHINVGDVSVMFGYTHYIDW